MHRAPNLLKPQIVCDFCILLCCVHDWWAVPDLLIGYVGLSLGPQNPRGPATNWYEQSQWLVYDHLDQTSSKFMSLITIHITIHVIQFYSTFVVITPGSSNEFPLIFNKTVGQVACQLLCRYTQSTLAASCVCWIVLIVSCVTSLHLIKARLYCR